jgi:hypothetical protein
MFEKIYAWLLRLFPSHFRETCGNDALQLVRDRARDEKGFFPRLRLALDLLADLAISVPREHRYVQPALIGAPDGVPSFATLEGEAPRAGALLFGSMLAMGALVVFWILFNHAGRLAVGGVSGPGLFQNVAGQSVKPDAEERQRVIAAAIANLKKHYADPDAARKMSEALLAHDKSGDDNTAMDGAAFADLLTRQMRNVSHDLHLEMVYSQEPLPPQRTAPTAEDLARYRQAMEANNCTFEKVAVLPHNIGYLKLDSFPDTSACQATATSAMASVNHADAIIFDLRDNGGGFPNMVALIASYLFNHPEYLYNPRESPTAQSWTRSPVAGNLLADKPVYVLTSSRTVSGAEQFCYNLKMLKRATLVGETTRGSAHSGVWHRIDDHFGMGIPEVQAINPYSKTDWEGTGVEPDVKVRAVDALATAESLAQSRLAKR